jgi:hypothetical protein
MIRISPRRPSAALVVSTAALVVALTGTGYAALSIPKNSVGTKQLKNNAVTSAKIKDGQVAGGDIAANAITSSKIKDGQVTSGDLATGAVTNAKIGSGAVANGNIVDGTITFGKAHVGDFAQGPGAIITLTGDVATGLESDLGPAGAFGDLSYSCATGLGGEDEVSVNNQTAGTLTLTVFSGGTVVGTPGTAVQGGDAQVTLNPTDTAYVIQLESGNEVATLSMTRVTTTDCHVVVQGVSNVS